MHNIFDTVCIVCWAGSMKWSSVRPSVRHISSSDVRQVCCWTPCRHDILINSSHWHKGWNIPQTRLTQQQQCSAKGSSWTQTWQLLKHCQSSSNKNVQFVSWILMAKDYCQFCFNSRVLLSIPSPATENFCDTCRSFFTDHFADVLAVAQPVVAKPCWDISWN